MVELEPFVALLKYLSSIWGEIASSGWLVSTGVLDASLVMAAGSGAGMIVGGAGGPRGTFSACGAGAGGGSGMGGTKLLVTGAGGGRKRKGAGPTLGRYAESAVRTTATMSDAPRARKIARRLENRRFVSDLMSMFCKQANPGAAAAVKGRRCADFRTQSSGYSSAGPGGNFNLSEDFLIFALNPGRNLTMQM